MLKEILSEKSCAACQVCCGFNREDVWETPIVFDETKKKAEALFPDIKFRQTGSAWTFQMEFQPEEQVIFCPILDRNTGCKLGDDKPFDCKIWPFRVMEHQEGLVITVASICPKLGTMEIEKLHQFLQKGLGDYIFSVAARHPEIVKPFQEGYPIICQKS